MVRTPSFDKNGMKKGTWTTEEDRKLVAYVTRYGCWNWRQLPKFAGLKRCGKSCRLRWMNYLRPNLKKGDYTKEEEEVIIRLHQTLGNKWSAMAAELPGRTDNEIKNHWHTHLKKRTNSSTRDHRDDHDHYQDSDDHDHENPQITDASDSQLASASQQTSLSGDELSTFTSDNPHTNVCLTEIISAGSHLIDSNVGDPLEAFSQFMSDDFWTKPFLADSSYFNNIDYFLSPALAEPEYFLSEFDANYNFFADSNFYQEHAQSHLHDNILD